AAERDDHRPRVAEDTPDLGHRGEAGEPVDVLESLEFAHLRIVTGFRRRRKGVAPGETRRTTTLKAKKLPTRFREEPFFRTEDPRRGKRPRDVPHRAHRADGALRAP